LSICPPSALRPYFQEGYLAATTDVTTDFDSKTELDFRNRLIAKFGIPRARAFWGSGFDQIPETALYPKGDKILELCNEMKTDLRDELQTGELGDFVRAWGELEEYLLERARRVTERNVSVREAIAALAKRAELGEDQAALLDSLRRFRNEVVHKPSKVHSGALREWLETTHQLSRQLRKSKTPT
jgi:hypothetical protein